VSERINEQEQANTPSLAKAAFSTALTEAMMVGFLIWENTVPMRDVSRKSTGPCATA